jgi:hypothetical protein
MEDDKCIYDMKGKKPVRKCSRLCEDNIKTDFKQPDAEVWL